MTPLQRFLAEAEARCAKATPGPWRDKAYTEDQFGVLAGDNPVAVIAEKGVDDLQDLYDAQFIAAARRDLPVALALLRAFAAVVEEAKTVPSMLGHTSHWIPSRANCPQCIRNSAIWSSLREKIKAADAAAKEVTGD